MKEQTKPALLFYRVWGRHINSGGKRMEWELETLVEYYFIHRVFKSYGFEKTQPQALMAYDRTAGQLVQKYGALYQTEVLMNSPVRSSFYYPSRILVASRCEKEAFAISFAKNILSVRGSIMEERQLGAVSSGTAAIVHTVSRAVENSYQVMFATFGKLQDNIVSFALANHIPFLTFTSHSVVSCLHEFIRVLLTKLKIHSGAYPMLLNFLKSSITLKQLRERMLSQGLCEELAEIEKFIHRTDFIAANVQIDFLEKGKVIYLIWI